MEFSIKRFLFTVLYLFVSIGIISAISVFNNTELSSTMAVIGLVICIYITYYLINAFSECNEKNLEVLNFRNFKNVFLLVSAFMLSITCFNVLIPSIVGIQRVAIYLVVIASLMAIDSRNSLERKYILFKRNTPKKIRDLLEKWGKS